MFVDAYSRVVLDLADLTFLSSLGMGALVQYRRGLSRRGIEIRLAKVQEQVWVALETPHHGQDRNLSKIGHFQGSHQPAP